MNYILHRFSRLAVWYENTPRPGLVLAGVVLILYGPFLAGGFAIDDFRVIRLCREYQAGEREQLDLYNFLDGGEGNHAQRAEGWYPWWLGDDVQYRHLRKFSEAIIYGEFLLYGDSPLGYRIDGLILYIIGVRLVSAIYRIIGGGERIARWAALFFTVAASNAVPVVFLSARGDLGVVVVAAGSVLLLARFLRDGGSALLLASAALFAVSLATKEATLPIAALPLCLWCAFRDRHGVGRRSVIATGLMSLVGIIWLSFYIKGGYGANGALMLNPVQDPLGYLSTMPGRSLLLLSSWLYPYNPFIFYFYPAWRLGLHVLGGLGGITLLLLGRMFWRHHRGDYRFWSMTLWVIPFMPLLVCTVPDNRVMMLPTIGLSYLGAIWMTQSRPAASGSRWLPVLFLLISPVLATIGEAAAVRSIERDSSQLARACVSGFGREVSSGDCVFYLNATNNFIVLFAQDTCRGVTGERDLRVAFLSDVQSPKVRVVDEYTLRLEATDDPILSTFVGGMGRSRNSSKALGDVFDAGEFEGKIVGVEDEDVTAVEFRFRRPLSSPGYRFYRCNYDGWISLLRKTEIVPFDPGVASGRGAKVDRNGPTANVRR